MRKRAMQAWYAPFFTIIMLKFYRDYVFLFIASEHILRMSSKKQYKLAVATVFKNEAHFLKEWIEYHLLIGVEHFYLFDNESTDDFESILAPYLDKKIVTWIPWRDRELPPNSNLAPDTPCLWVRTTQVPAYTMACHAYAKNTSEWLAMIDIDEFLVPTCEDSFHKILEKYKDACGLELFWTTYGSSDVMSLPKNTLLIEVMKRTYAPTDWLMCNAFKTILKPDLFAGFHWAAHSCHYLNGEKAVQLSKAEARINHYMVRTLDHLEQKIKYREKMSNQVVTEKERKELLVRGNEVEDTERAILRFAPELRRRMGF